MAQIFFFRKAPQFADFLGFSDGNETAMWRLGLGLGLGLELGFELG
jgi:hypothetical protein